MSVTTEHVMDVQAASKAVSRRAPGRSYLTPLILLLGVGVFSVNVVRHILVRWDDAFITFRYAQHVAQGQGLVWNLGGERVEGFTSLLDVLLLALGIKAGITPVVWSVVLGVLSVLGAVALMGWALRRQVGVHPVAAAMIGLYLADDITAVHATSGLETQLFVLVLSALYASALWMMSRPRVASALVLAACSVLLVLTRPEGALYAFGIYAVLAVVFYARREQGGGWTGLKRLTLSAVVVGLLGVVYLLWKLSYFGYALPNPFYVKSDAVHPNGIMYVGYYLLTRAAYFAPALLGLGYLLIKREVLLERLDLEQKAGLSLLLVPAGLALAYYSTIVHETGGAHRFSYPTYLLLVTALAWIASLLLQSRPVASERIRATTVAILLCAAGMGIAQTRLQLHPLPVDGFTQYHMRIAEALRSTGLGAEGRILNDAAGVIPYYSGFTQIDRIGLNDNFLSGRKKVGLREREDYMLNQHPDVYITYEPQASPLSSGPGSDPIMKSPYVQDVLLRRGRLAIGSRMHYADEGLLYYRMKVLRDRWYLVGEIEYPGTRLWGLHSYVYVSKASPHADVLLRALKKIVSS